MVKLTPLGIQLLLFYVALATTILVANVTHNGVGLQTRIQLKEKATRRIHGGQQHRWSRHHASCNNPRSRRPHARPTATGWRIEQLVWTPRCPRAGLDESGRCSAVGRAKGGRQRKETKRSPHASGGHSDDNNSRARGSRLGQGQGGAGVQCAQAGAG